MRSARASIRWKCGSPAHCYALCKSRFFSGSSRIRLPVVAKIALQSAAATSAGGGSPTPPQNPPLGMIMLSTFGASARRTIVTRLGAIALEPVVVTIGATLVSDTVSLIIFGICVSTYTTGFSPSGLTLQIVEVAIFVPLILVGVSRAGAWILNKLKDNQAGYFVTMLGIMAVA